jgi:hypothetical protein
MLHAEQYEPTIVFYAQQNSYNYNSKSITTFSYLLYQHFMEQTYNWESLFFCSWNNQLTTVAHSPPPQKKNIQYHTRTFIRP